MLPPLALFFLAAFLLLSPPLTAQNWTQEERSAIAGLERCMQAYQNSDRETWRGCVADDFVGWNYGMPGTRDAEWHRSVLDNPNRRPLVMFSIQPLNVRVHDNVAILHYYYYTAMENPDGSMDYGRARWTDVMRHEGGDRWVWIADHGGPDPASVGN